MHWAETDVHLHIPGRRFHITLTERQYTLLKEESLRTGLAMAEIARRSIDTVLRPHRRIRFSGIEVTFTVAREVDAALAARRVRSAATAGQTGSARRPVVDGDYAREM